jgi:hypothetical protein
MLHPNPAHGPPGLFPEGVRPQPLTPGVHPSSPTPRRTPPPVRRLPWPSISSSPRTTLASSPRKKPAYKYPSGSSLISFCFSSKTSTDHGEISRRIPQHLQASPNEFVAVGERRPFSSLLSPSPLSGAHADVFLLPNLAGNQAPHPRPKVTAAPHDSSRVYLPLLDMKHDADQTNEIASSYHTTSWSP